MFYMMFESGLNSPLFRIVLAFILVLLLLFEFELAKYDSREYVPFREVSSEAHKTHEVNICELPVLPLKTSTEHVHIQQLLFPYPKHMTGSSSGNRDDRNGHNVNNMDGNDDRGVKDIIFYFRNTLTFTYPTKRSSSDRPPIQSSSTDKADAAIDLGVIVSNVCEMKRAALSTVSARHPDRRKVKRSTNEGNTHIKISYFSLDDEACHPGSSNGTGTGTSTGTGTGTGNRAEYYSLEIESEDSVHFRLCTPRGLYSALQSTLLQMLASSPSAEDVHSSDNIQREIMNDSRIIGSSNGNEGWTNNAVIYADIITLPTPSYPFKIIDYPRYTVRGFMVDLARHYIPLPLLKRCINAMSMSKLNRLHLHLTDSQSFPLLLDDVPITVNGKSGKLLALSRLGREGRYDDTKMYTLSQLATLVQYAQHKGVEIVPEIDFPAHVHVWGKAFPSLLVTCPEYSAKQQSPSDIHLLDVAMMKQFNIPSLSLLSFDHKLPIPDISKTETMELVKAILAQISSVFPSRDLHIGGDEVHFACWESNIDFIETVLKQQNKETVLAMNRTSSAFNREARGAIKEAYRLFEKEVFDYIQKGEGSGGLGRRAVVWEGVVSDGAFPWYNDTDATASVSNAAGAIDSDSARRGIVQPWKCWSDLAIRSSHQSIDHGHPVIMSACWYMDYNQDWLSYLGVDMANSAVTRYSQKSSSSNSIYATHIGNLNITHKAQNMKNQDNWQHASHYMLGGEGTMFTEGVDHSNFECRVWPRAGAWAARLWGLDEDNRLSERVSPASPTVGNNANSGEESKTLDSSKSVHLSLSQTRDLYHSLASYRRVLWEGGIKAAPLVFHEEKEKEKEKDEVSSTNMVGSASMGGELRPSSLQGHLGLERRYIDRKLSLLSSTNTSQDNSRDGVFISSDGRLAQSLESTQHPLVLKITCECLPIPQTLQRPYLSNRVKISQLNIADGATHSTQRSLLTSWLYRKASEGVSIVGLCELNTWQQAKSTNRGDVMSNRGLGDYIAGKSGYPYFHLMHGTTHPYHLGVLSVYPFAVLGEYGPSAGFQRGCLHVYFTALDLHVLVVHLHAHSASMRTVEANKIVQIMSNYQMDTPRKDDKSGSNGSARFIVMGDMNTLSPFDANQHRQDQLVQTLQRTDHSVWKRLREKFLKDHDDESAVKFHSSIAFNDTVGRDAEAVINYDPMHTFLQHNLVDSCIVACLLSTLPTPSKDKGGKSKGYYYHRLITEMEKLRSDPAKGWRIGSTKSTLSECMSSQCAATEPTGYSNEWPTLSDRSQHPFVRLDYILMSANMLQEVLLDGITPPGITGRSKNAMGKGLVSAYVGRDNVTEMLSDHYPMNLEYVSIPYALY